jgi:hypothetical protein
VICQLAEVIIQHEADLVERLWPNSSHPGYINRLEGWIYAYPISISHHVREINRFAADQYQINLDVWDAERFDQVFDRGATPEAVLEFDPLPRWGEEIIQRRIEPEESSIHEIMIIPGADPKEENEKACGQGQLCCILPC